MLKATKLTLAAAFLAGSCGLAMAQASGGASGVGTDTQPGVGATNQGGNPTAGPKKGAAKPMTQKNTGMPTPTKQTGQETGTAKDSAGPGAMRDESQKENKKQ